MKIYLVSSGEITTKSLIKYNLKNVLISYYNFFRSSDTRNYWEIMQELPKDLTINKNWQGLLKNFDSCMVDSGAYTYQVKSGLYGSEQKKEINTSLMSLNKIDKFTESYGKWLTDNKRYYDYYFEMDIDKIIGLKKVEEYRSFLEKCAGKQCIPVWHENRGIEYWEKMITDYKFVAVGGIASGEFLNPERQFSYMVDLAHNKNCRVHGMGFTKFRYLKFIPFDTLDSSTWMMGARRGVFQLFLDGTMRTLSPKDIGSKNTHIYYKDFFDMNAQSWKAYGDYLEEYWERQKRQEVLLNEDGIKN